MKFTFLTLLLTLSFNSLADISHAQEKQIVKNIAKELSQDLLFSGHDFVDSKVERFSKRSIQNFLGQKQNLLEETLSESESREAIRCVRSSLCMAYKIEISSEYYGGYGFDYSIVLLDLTTGKYDLKTYIGYNE